MKNYTVDTEKKWDYENGFYLTCETNRIGKLLNHLEIYKKIVDLPGVILEFGVYKGTSLVRLMTFRDLLETQGSRKVVGFDIFGKFPDTLEMEADRNFVEKFENNGGFGISRQELDYHLKNKGFTNYELMEGIIFDTLPKFLLEHPAPKIALLPIDVNVYEPSKLIIEMLWDRIVAGGIMMLDDYGTVAGETKAVDDFFMNQHISIQKIKYNHIPSYIVKQ